MKTTIPKGRGRSRKQRMTDGQMIREIINAQNEKYMDEKTRKAMEYGRRKPYQI